MGVYKVLLEIFSMSLERPPPKKAKKNGTKKDNIRSKDFFSFLSLGLLYLANQLFKCWLFEEIYSRVNISKIKSMIIFFTMFMLLSSLHRHFKFLFLIS